MSALLRRTGQVSAECGWTGQNPSLEDAAATLVTSRVGPWIGSRPGDRAPGPDSDSATHRVTLDKCCPPWGPAAPPLWWECWTKQRTFTLSFELHSEGTGSALELWQMTLNPSAGGMEQPPSWTMRLGQWGPQVSPPWAILLLKHRSTFIFLGSEVPGLFSVWFRKIEECENPVPRLTGINAHLLFSMKKN